MSRLLATLAQLGSDRHVDFRETAFKTVAGLGSEDRWCAPDPSDAIARLLACEKGAPFQSAMQFRSMGRARNPTPAASRPRLRVVPSENAASRRGAPADTARGLVAERIAGTTGVAISAVGESTDGSGPYVEVEACGVGACEDAEARLKDIAGLEQEAWDSGWSLVEASGRAWRFRIRTYPAAPRRLRALA